MPPRSGFPAEASCHARGGRRDSLRPCDEGRAPPGARRRSLQGSGEGGGISRSSWVVWPVGISVLVLGAREDAEPVDC
jgi:hypothetical protein